MEFVLLAAAHFMALLSPGPDFFLILNTSLKKRRLYAVFLCLGIAFANGIYISIAVAGLETVRYNEVLMLIMKYLGGAYLFFIGISLLRTKKRSMKDQQEKTVPRNTGLGFWLLGFFSAILNPKNMIFYLSLFTVMVSGSTPFVTRLLYGIWMCSIVLIWDLLIVFVLSNEKLQMHFERYIAVVERLSGFMLAFFGTLLTFS